VSELARCTAVATWVAPWVIVPGAPPIRDGAVAFDAAGELVAVGRAADFARCDATAVDGVIMPGLVNAHTHLELSHMAGAVPGGDGLVPWIRRLLASRTPPQGAAIAAAIAYLEERGTVAVADVTNSGTTVGPLERSGLTWRAFREVVAPRPGEPVDLGELPRGGHVIRTAHSTYATREDVLRAVGAASIHVEEDPAEAEWLVRGSGPFGELLPRGPAPGARPVEYLDALGLLHPGTLLVHMAHASDESFRLAARRGAVIVLCPRSNLTIGGRPPRWRAAREAGCRVAVGTDSLASSPSLDVLADVAALARDGAEASWLVDAATVGGARALGLYSSPGWIEIGDAAATLRDPVAWVAFEGEAAATRRIA
jgi:aminodeoxyfutalosine deaminase